MDDLPDREHLHLLAENFERSYPHEIIAWASHTYGDGLVMATGFGPEGIVIMHIVSQVAPKTKIFYLDTDLFFPETYALRDELQQRFNLSFERVATTVGLDQQTEQYGPELWSHDPNLCCGIRKVQPLRTYLKQKKAWITAIRRDQTRTRQTAKPIEWDETNGLVKLNPLLNWSHEQVWTYIYLFDLPTNSLHKSGYPSIGCWPCTRPAAEGANPRSGRWVGFQKVECGIHVKPSDEK
jgi:phosphoadenosine phosphosulfate reductase